MQPGGEKTRGIPRWRAPAVIVAVRLVVAISLALMALLFTGWLTMRWPGDYTEAAVDKFVLRHAALNELEHSLRLLRAVPGELVAEPATASAAAEPPSGFHRRLSALASTSCEPGREASADSKLIEELGRLVTAFQALHDTGSDASGLAGRGSELVTLIGERLRELDSSAVSCMMVQEGKAIVLRERIRAEALAMVALLVLAGAGMVLVRQNDVEQLRDQLRFNEQMFDAIPLPLSLRSPQGRFMLVNQAFESRHSVSREELLGEHVVDKMSRANADAILQMDARASQSVDPVDETFETTDDAGTRYVQVRVHALRRLDGSVIGTVGIQTDVTTLRRKAAELVDLNTRLSELSTRIINAQEEERKRISRDLHDQVGQILTALKLQLASLARGGQIEAPATALKTTISMTEEALRQTRDLSASLHPHLLDDLGLESALNSLIERLIRPTVPTIELRCTLAPARGPEQIELVAFRVVQEALTNVMRHAAATRVGVALEAMDGKLVIEVIDDGVGLGAGNKLLETQRRTSFGVTSMRHRVTEVGGKLVLESAQHNGTSLRAELPWSINEQNQTVASAAG